MTLIFNFFYFFATLQLLCHSAAPPAFLLLPLNHAHAAIAAIPSFHSCTTTPPLQLPTSADSCCSFRVHTGQMSLHTLLVPGKLTFRFKFQS